MIFIDNKYTDWYYAIVNNSKSRERPIGYIERHHIIPSSLGGNNKLENLAILTPREHFVCHLLLTKMTHGNAMFKMKFAFSMMVKINNIGEGRYRPSSRFYEIAKKSFKESLTNYWTADARKIHADKISKATKGSKKSESAKESYRNKVWTEKALQNLTDIGIKSAALRKGKPWSEHVRNARLNSYLQKNLEIAKQVMHLYEHGSSRLSISKQINISWDRVDLILKYTREFNMLINGFPK